MVHVSNSDAAAAKKSISLFAVGDVMINRDNPESIFELCLPALKEADVRFCQLESVISSRGSPTPGGGGPFRVDPKNVNGLKHARFDVVSPNGNHAMDWGAEALLDTVDLLRSNGIKSVGVGKNINEARAPVFFESSGNKIAFLSYNSIMRPGYWAERNRPGCAPLRAHTFTELLEIDQPGTPCLVHTSCNLQDLAALQKDIEKAKSEADVVVVSLHFGLHLVRARLAEYQQEVCHAAVDSGADVIIGHHPHVLKAIEIYKGKVIFYSLGNFVFDAPIPPSKEIEMAVAKHMFELYGLKADPDDPLRTFFPADSRNTMIVKILIKDKKIDRVSFLPCLTNKKNQCQVLDKNNSNFNSIVQYVEEITKEAGIQTQFKVEGNEVFIK